MAIELGMKEIMIAVLAVIILILIVMLLLGLVESSSESAFIFGQRGGGL